MHPALVKKGRYQGVHEDLKKVMSVLNFVTGFLTGVYAGLYAAKHYQVPEVPEPAEVLDKAKKFIDQFKKESEGDDDKK